MLKLSAMFLVTFNLWASLICCCQGISCGPHAGCDEDTVAVMDQMGPHDDCDQGSMAAMDQVDTHGAQDHCGNRKSQTSPKKASSILKSCNCGNHQRVPSTGVLPNLKSVSTEAPMVLVLVAWFAGKQLAVATRAFSEALPVSRVSARFAPSLSVLSRLLI